MLWVTLGLIEIREVPARLVAAAVFKTVGTVVNRRFGGFDSHALPLRHWMLSSLLSLNYLDSPDRAVG
jgi:hypothetical protein